MTEEFGLDLGLAEFLTGIAQPDEVFVGFDDDDDEMFGEFLVEFDDTGFDADFDDPGGWEFGDFDAGFDDDFDLEEEFRL